MKANIATTPEQSKRLLACGVDPKSADMVWQEPITTSQKRTGGKILVFRNPNHQDYVGDVPAWSLSRILDLLPMYIDLRNARKCHLSMSRIGGEYRFYYGNNIANTANTNPCVSPDPIESCVRNIEWLAKEGYKLNTI